MYANLAQLCHYAGVAGVRQRGIRRGRIRRAIAYDGRPRLIG